VRTARNRKEGNMSCVLVLTPLVIAGWPVVAGAVTAAVTSMGFNLVSSGSEAVAEKRSTKTERVEVELEESEILAEAMTNQRVVVERDGMRAVFTRDERGALRVCMEGEGYSKAQLKKTGEDLINRVTQQFVYHRVVSELKQRNMQIVDEQVSADRTVKIRVRNL
jgi:hypothetical protein